MSEVRFDLEQMTAGADGVFVVVRISGRGGGSGIELEGRYFHAYELEDGLVRRVEVHVEPEPALRAAGVEP